jgi:hypothetical protein
VLVCLLALAVGCGKRSSTPTSPSATLPAGEAAVGDGTLKVTAPTPISPINGQKPTGELVLVTGHAAPVFVGTALPFNYQFEIYTQSGTRIYQSGLVAQASGSSTSHKPVVTLTPDVTYGWQVRAEFQGNFGPYSNRATFVANRPAAFITATTLWDPLDNSQDGFAARNISGPHHWIPGVGLSLDAFETFVYYELPDGGRIEEGEMSAVISNTPANTEGVKTKVMAMSAGYSDLATNPARATFEKRGDGPTGGVAWRFLTTGEGAETIGAEREIFTGFNDGPYFWDVTWRNSVIRVRILEGGFGGREVYNLGKEYDGFYNPVPHVIWLGSQHSRSGPENWTVPGMIISKVWVSWDPRPPYANY